MLGQDLYILLSTIILSFLPALVDSSLGMGYGFTMTPILLLLGFTPLQAVPAVLVSSLMADLISSYFHHKFKNVDFSLESKAFKIAVVMGGLGAVGGLFGALVAVGISTFLLRLYIGTLVTVMGVVVLLSRRKRSLDPIFSWPRIIMCGVLGAFNKGLGGFGFGPIVTTGGLMAGLDEKATVSIQCLAETFVCVVAFTTFLLSGVQIDWYLSLAVSIGVVLSSPAAAFFVHKMPTKILRGLIGLGAVSMGLYTLIELLL